VFGYGTGTLTATTSADNSDPSAVVFTNTLNPNGGNGSASTYTIDFNQTIDNGSGVSFDDLTSSAAGNVNYRGVGVDDPNTAVDLLLSASKNTDGDPAYEDATVNTNVDAVGSANQSMNPGEAVRIDFVSNLESGGATPSGFTYDGHVGTQSFLQSIPQVQGNQATTASFTVYALNTSATQADNLDRDPTDGVSDSSVVEVTSVTIQDYLTGNTTTLDISNDVSYADGVTYNLAYGVSFRPNADGTVTFFGVQEGDHYGIGTSTDFNAVLVQSTVSEFDLGVFSIGQVDNGDPLDLSFDVTATDGDGDTSTGTIDVTLVPDSPQGFAATTLAADSAPADDTSFSLLATDGQDQQLQKTAANSNTTLLAAAVAASGLAGTQAAASPGGSDHGHQVIMDAPSVASKFASLAVDSGDDSRSMLSSETKVAANDEPQTLQSSHGTEDFSSSVQGLDNAPAHLPADLSAFFAAGDQGPAANAAAAGPVAPAVAMVSAEALQAAGIDGSAKHGGAVDKVVADALGHDAPPTVDGLLQALGGQAGGQLAAISHVASPAADAVPAWDMGGHGAFVPGADMMFKMGAEMLHHDAVQPVVNG
jgi:hypothetical protein